MTWSLLILGALGFGLTIWGAIRTHRGQARRDAADPDILIIKVSEGFLDLSLTIFGAVLVLGSLFISLIQ